MAARRAIAAAGADADEDGVGSPAAQLTDEDMAGSCARIGEAAVIAVAPSVLPRRHPPCAGPRNEE
jgi:hypothetical protein